MEYYNLCLNDSDDPDNDDPIQTTIIWVHTCNRCGVSTPDNELAAYNGKCEACEINIPPRSAAIAKNIGVPFETKGEDTNDTTTKSTTT